MTSRVDNLPAPASVMATMATAKVGRKRQSPIWDFFEYDCVNDKRKCLVVEAGDTICGILLKGKNECWNE